MRDPFTAPQPADLVRMASGSIAQVIAVDPEHHTWACGAVRFRLITSASFVRRIDYIDQVREFPRSAWMALPADGATAIDRASLN